MSFLLLLLASLLLMQQQQHEQREALLCAIVYVLALVDLPLPIWSSPGAEREGVREQSGKKE